MWKRKTTQSPCFHFNGSFSIVAALRHHRSVLRISKCPQCYRSNTGKRPIPGCPLSSQLPRPLKTFKGVVSLQYSHSVLVFQAKMNENLFIFSSELFFTCWAFLMPLRENLFVNGTRKIKPHSLVYEHNALSPCTAQVCCILNASTHDWCFTSTAGFQSSLLKNNSLNISLHFCHDIFFF